MKNVFIALLVHFAAAVPALAIPGSACGLADANNEADWQIVPGSKTALHHLSAKQIEALPTLVKQQVIIAANHALNRYGAPTVSVSSTKEAIQILIGRDPEAYYWHFSYGGKVFTEVQHYPGDNQYSVVFKYGTRSIIGGTEDGDIVCY